jgi:hypothetical protein
MEIISEYVLPQFWEGVCIHKTSYDNFTMNLELRGLRGLA